MSTKYTDDELFLLSLMKPGVVITVALTGAVLMLDRDRSRRLLNKLVKSGDLLREQRTFWNGMHYAKRDYFTKGT